MTEAVDGKLTISVAAGKGGTGKTLIATSLALAVEQAYPDQVQFLDCDVEEPNGHILLHPQISAEKPVSIPVPQVDLEVCTRCGKCAEVCHESAIVVIRQAVLTFPELCSGCGACSYICPSGAITEMPWQVGTLYLGQTPEGIEFCGGQIWVGNQRATPVTKAVKKQVREDKINVIDAPPGTACPMQETVAESDYCLLVTEPTPFGLSDLRAAVETCRSLEVPCGILINRYGSGFTGVEEYCEQEGLEILMKVPQERSIAEAYSRGEALVSAQPEWSEKLLDLFETIGDGIAN